MPLFPACTIGNTMLIGVDAHSTAIPPVPLNPHPYVGPLMLWTTPKFPMANTMVSYVPTCCVGAKGYSVHVPQGTWVDIPKVSFKVWYLTNLITVGITTVFSILANIQLAIVQGMLTSFVKPTDAAFKETWTKICAQFAPFTSWQTWAQLLIPPLPLPGAEGNAAIGSPTVSVNGGSMALGVPLGGASCSEIPIVPNASIITFSNVMVGVTFAQLVEQFFNNAVQGAINYAGGKVAKGYLDRNRCRLGLEPIDLVSGANFEDKVDFELPGTLPITWKRYYASSLDLDGNLGWNWSHEYSHWLEFGSRQITYHNHQNRAIAFPHLKNDGESHYLPFDRLTLVRISEKSWLIRTIDGRVIGFSREPGKGEAWVRRIETRAGESIVFRYDTKGFLHEIACPCERRLRISTDNEGRILRVVLHGPSGREYSLVAYRYDQRGDLVEITDADGKTSTYGYDDNHLMTRKTDRRGYSFHYEYDHNGRCIRSRGDDDLYAGEVEYIPPVQTTILTAPAGGKYIYRYNDQMLVTSILDPHGGVQVFEYDDDGNLVAEVDENGFATKYAYDDFGNVVEETNPFGGTTKRTYNEQNLKVEEVDPDGNTQVWEYDERGNLIREVDIAGNETAHTYNDRNQRTETHDPSGAMRRFEYDERGWLIAEKSGAGASIRDFVYDDHGRTQEMTFAGIQKTRYEYDAHGRRRRITFPDGTAEENRFDEEGNVLEFRDRNGRQWAYTYASWNKLVETRDPLHGRLRFSYSKADELIEVVDPNGQRTTYTRDQKDRIAEVNYGDAVHKLFDFDPGRNPAQCRTPAGELLFVRTFAPQGKRATQQLGDAPVIAYEYDQSGRLAAAGSDDGQITRSYDPMGRILEAAWNDDSIQLTYDANGRYESIAWSEGLECKFSYRAGGDVLIVTDPAGGKHTVWSPHEQSSSHLCPNQLMEIWRAYTSGEYRMREHSLAPNSAHPDRVLISDRYQFDRLGNLVRREDSATEAVSQYRYDALDRLVQMAELGQGQARFEHDRGGNLFLDVNKEIQIGPANRIDAVGKESLRYDALGRLAGRDSAHGATTYQHDSLGQLCAVTPPTGKTIAFGYDPDGCRLWKETDGQRTVTHWLRHRLQREIFSESHRRLYVYLHPDDDAPFMCVDLIKSGDADTWDVKPYYIHCDHLATPQVVTDADGKVVWRLTLGAWGEGTVDASDDFVLNLRRPGRYHDSETGLDYNGRRYYDPTLGRFIEPDPLGLAGGWNLYAAPSNPLRDLDRMGTSHDCTSSKPPATDEEDEPSTTPRTTTDADGTQLKFGDNDLVYGPSAGGKLRGLQEEAGGKLLTDLGDLPDKKTWTEHSLDTLNKAAESGQQVHFDITNMGDMDDVLAGRGRHDPEATNKIVTSEEIRHIRDNWDNFKTKPKFYKNGQEVPPPWT